MSLIWVILVNTILGMVLFPLSVYLIMLYADKKYGIDVCLESSEDNLKTVEDFSTMTGINNRFLLYLTMVLSVIFWEIMIPFNTWVNITKIKDLHELRGGDNRKITRIKDLKAKELKADIKYAKTMIEISKNQRTMDTEVLLYILKHLDPSSESYKLLVILIDSWKEEIKDCDMFLQDLEKYH